MTRRLCLVLWAAGGDKEVVTAAKQAIQKRHPAVPKQPLTRRPVLFGYAIDGQQVPELAIVPTATVEGVPFLLKACQQQTAPGNVFP